MTEAEIVAWHVEPGQTVRAGDALLTIETDKAEYEVEAPVDGSLAPYAAGAGETVLVGALLGWVLAESETLDDLPAPGDSPPTILPDDRARADEPLVDRPERVRASPKARRLAIDLGVELAALAGSGEGGLVTAEDVERAAAAAPSSDRWRGRTVRERRRLAGVRLAGARNTTLSWTTTPHFVQMIDADMTRIRDLRSAWRGEDGPRAVIGYNDFVVAALARSLVELPDLNAGLDGEELVLFADVNVGLAVDTPRGLQVPVIRRADRQSLAELAHSGRVLAAKARGGRLSPDETGCGTATVSNLGAYGIRAGTPVLNAPESVLVFVGSVEDRAVVRDGAIGIRPTCTLSIAYDHRVTDGASAARLSARLRELLGDPSPLL